MIASLRRIVRWLETRPWSAGQLIALFLATVILRNLLEGFHQGSLFHWTAFVYHFPIAYIFPSLALIAALHYLAGRYSLVSLARLMAFAWTLTLLPPILDAVLGRPGSPIGYFPLERSNLVYFLVNFFNPAVELSGTTAGIRIEAAIGCLLAGLFVAVVAEGRRLVRLLRGVATVVLFGPIFLCFFTWPYMIHALLSRLFPWAASTQAFYQMRLVTHQGLVGSVHLGVFFLDLLPVTLLLVWFIRGLTRPGRSTSAGSWSELAPPAVPALAGSIAAILATAGLRLALGDLLAMMGAFLASLSFGIATLAVERPRGERLRMALCLYSGFVALAVGWHALVVTLLGIVATRLRMPASLRRGVTYAFMYLIAASPVLVSMTDWAARWPVLLGFVAAALPGSRLGRSSLRHLPLVPAFILALVYLPGWLPARLFDLRTAATDLTRSWRPACALSIARKIPAAGGDYRLLAQTAQTIGHLELARWAFVTGLQEGDSSVANLKVGINLALEEEDWATLDQLVPIFVDRAGAGSAETANLMFQLALRRALSYGDRAALDHVFERAGPGVEVYRTYHELYAETDPGQARSFLLAACSHPDATPSTWSELILKLGESEQALLDSVTEEAGNRFPGSADLMLAEAVASMSRQGGSESRSAGRLIRDALELEPFNGRAHRVALLWYQACGELDSALSHASIAIALEPSPDRDLMELASETALVLERWETLLALSGYAIEEHPHSPRFRVYRARALMGLEREAEAAEELEQVLGGSLSGAAHVFPDPFMDSLCVSLSDSLY